MPSLKIFGLMFCICKVGAFELKWKNKEKGKRLNGPGPPAKFLQHASCPVPTARRGARTAAPHASTVDDRRHCVDRHRRPRARPPAALIRCFSVQARSQDIFSSPLFPIAIAKRLCSAALRLPPASRAATPPAG
jgi:hypothetical protein